MPCLAQVGLALRLEARKQESYLGPFLLPSIPFSQESTYSWFLSSVGICILFRVCRFYMWQGLSSRNLPCYTRNRAGDFRYDSSNCLSSDGELLRHFMCNRIHSFSQSQNYVYFLLGVELLLFIEFEMFVLKYFRPREKEK